MQAVVVPETASFRKQHDRAKQTRPQSDSKSGREVILTGQNGKEPTNADNRNTQAGTHTHRRQIDF